MRNFKLTWGGYFRKVVQKNEEETNDSNNKFDNPINPNSDRDKLCSL